jgi:hypothetical protein
MLAEILAEVLAEVLVEVLAEVPAEVSADVLAGALAQVLVEVLAAVAPAIAAVARLPVQGDLPQVAQHESLAAVVVVGMVQRGSAQSAVGRLGMARILSLFPRRGCHA